MSEFVVIVFSVFKSFSPRTEDQTLYSVESENTTNAYSTPGFKYKGYSNLKLVGTMSVCGLFGSLPDAMTSLFVFITLEPGTISVVGIPNSVGTI